MSALIIMSFTVCSLLMLPLMAQPLSLGLTIMICTCSMCCLLGITLSSWYGYILFLIYVGALLVMFAYVAALSPNILFGGVPPLTLIGFMFLLVAVGFYVYPFSDLCLIGGYEEYVVMNCLKAYSGEFVTFDNASVLVGLAIILLINLVAVVKICRYQKAALRPFKGLSL